MHARHCRDDTHACTLPHKQVIKGFDTAVTGLAVGGSRKSRIPPEDAYGNIDPSMQMGFPRQKGAPDGLKEGAKVGKGAAAQHPMDALLGSQFEPLISPVGCWIRLAFVYYLFIFLSMCFH